MFGVFKFVAEAGKHNVKPIVGCEFYVVDDRHKKQFTKEKKDVRRHQLFLLKMPRVIKPGEAMLAGLYGRLVQ